MKHHLLLEDRWPGCGAARRHLATERVASVREATRLRRLAHQQRQLWLFYLEHNLFDAARDTRHDVLDSLRRARLQWQMTLAASL